MTLAPDTPDAGVLRHRAAMLRVLVSKAALLDPRTCAYAIQEDWGDSERTFGGVCVPVPGAKSRLLEDMKELVTDAMLDPLAKG